MSSSEVVHNIGTDNFNYIILAEFWSSEDAYDFENSLIEENFTDPLILNRSYTKSNKRRFRRVGKHSEKSIAKMTGMKRTPETKAKISAGLTGNVLSDEHKSKISASHKCKTLTYDHRKKIGDSLLGRKHSEETKTKLSKAAKSREPVSSETKAKQSIAAKNRPIITEEARKNRSDAVKRSWIERKRKIQELSLPAV